MSQWIAQQSKSRFGTWAVYTRVGYYDPRDPTAPGCSVETSRKAAELQAAAPELLVLLRSLINGEVRMSDKSDNHLSEHDENVIAARALIGRLQI